MVEHLTDEQIESYRKRTMKPDGLLSADKHFLSCEDCRARLQESGRLQAAFRNVKQNLQSAARASPEHLEYELLEAYVDNRSDTLDREIIESHIEICADCAGELHELQKFAAMLQAASVREGEKIEKASPWQRLFSLIGLPATQAGGAPAGFRLAGAVAMVLLIAAASVFVIYKALNSESGPIAQGNGNQSLPANQNENPNVNEQVQPDNPIVAQGNQNQNEANRNIQTPQPRPTSVFAFLVPLEISRGGGVDKSTLKISPDVGFVELKVEVENAEGKSFTAQLQKIGGATQNLKTSIARNGVVTFKVAASDLNDGQYDMKIFRLPRNPDDSAIETVFKVEKVRQ
jgi:hypothetical protein